MLMGGTSNSTWKTVVTITAIPAFIVGVVSLIISIRGCGTNEKIREELMETRKELKETKDKMQLAQKQSAHEWVSSKLSIRRNEPQNWVNLVNDAQTLAINKNLYTVDSGRKKTNLEGEKFLPGDLQSKMMIVKDDFGGDIVDHDEFVAQVIESYTIKKLQEQAELILSERADNCLDRLKLLIGLITLQTGRVFADTITLKLSAASIEQR